LHHAILILILAGVALTAPR